MGLYPTKAIFFDWDGTLVNTLGLLSVAHNHVRAELGFPLWSKEEYTAAMTRSTRELYPILYGERSAEAQVILYDYIKANHLEYLEKMPGAVELLDQIQALGIPMGVVSNKRDDVLVREVEALGWEKYFGVYNGAGVAAQDKPSAVPLFHAMALHPGGVTPEGFMYVGDTETDLRAIREAGCIGVFVQHDGPREDLVETYKPDIVVNNLHELSEMLIEILQPSVQKNA